MTRDEFIFGAGRLSVEADAIACAKDIERSLSSVASSVEKVRNEVLGLWGNARAKREEVFIKDLYELQKILKGLLSRKEVKINGAGFVAAPAVLEDAHLHLEWWREGVKSKHFIPLKVNLDEGGDTFYDYPNMPWFYKPENEKVGHVTGPYVDMMGVDMYICTFSLPVVFEGKFIGIAGADVPVTTLEEVVVPHLVSHEGVLVLVNENLRIISSNSSKHQVGEFYKPQFFSENASYCKIDFGYSLESWRLVFERR